VPLKSRRIVLYYFLPSTLNKHTVARAAVIVTYRVYHLEEKKLYEKKIYPGQSYIAWDGNPPVPGYAFHAICYNMYIDDSAVYGSGTTETSWTCPEYVYGQEGNPQYKVDYAIAWTDAQAGASTP
jgi:hypothetical protein